MLDRMVDPSGLGLVRKMKKPNTFDTFLYRQFKQTGHSPSTVLIQTDEKLYMIKILHLN